MARADGLQYASYLLAQAQSLGTVYLGYAYIDEYGDEEIYWCPYEMILDGDIGAVEYIPIYQLKNLQCLGRRDALRRAKNLQLSICEIAVPKILNKLKVNGVMVIGWTSNPVHERHLIAA